MSEPVEPGTVFREIKWVVEQTIRDHPRSQQKAIGASEIGTACERRLAWKLAQLPTLNEQPPAWRPTVGTAVHTWMEDAFEAHNINGGAVEKDTGRWLTERRLIVGALGGNPVWGTCDLYDRVTGFSIDHKVVGRTTLRNAKRGRVDQGYKVQGQVYARGWAARGFDVQGVMIIFWPSSGELSEAAYWAEPYDPRVAADAFARAERVQTLVNALGAERVLPVLPIADAHCSHCPAFRIGASGGIDGCPGVEELQDRHPVRDSIADLVHPNQRKEIA